MNTTIPTIQMVDLKTQYNAIQEEVDKAVIEVVRSGAFINGPKVKEFKADLETYLGVKHVIPCGNGTDALQIALMALELQAGDEVIVPAFTFAATAEVIALLRLKPVMVDVDPDTFNVTAEIIEAAITDRTKAVVPVNLFGQSCDMDPILEVCKKHKIWIVEDNAQAIGAAYTSADGKTYAAGSVGHIGCTSFYPSKNLGAYGDAGACFTNDDELARKIQMVANHGMDRRYYHDMVGVNSRMDSIQAAILSIKLKHLDAYCANRQAAAAYYDKAFAGMDHVIVPKRQHNSTHVFHQYTLRITNGKRDELQAFLQEKSVPSMIYYPVPLYKQDAYKELSNGVDALEATDLLSDEVISLPMHSELTEEVLSYIVNAVKAFF